MHFTQPGLQSNHDNDPARSLLERIPVVVSATVFVPISIYRVYMRVLTP